MSVPIESVQGMDVIAQKLDILIAASPQSALGSDGKMHTSLGGFRFPITLPVFNQVVAMTGYSAQAAPQLIMQVATVPPISSGGVPGQASTTFLTPEGYTAIAVSNTTASAQEYSQDLLLSVWIDEGQSGQLLAANEVPVTEQITIPDNLIGATPIYNNLTGLWYNYTSSAIEVTVQGVMLLVQNALYSGVYKPFFYEQFLGLQKVVAAFTKGG
ncbi:MAG: hypothetical protein M0Z85_00035 [Gammaproteobacteria bacterium]|nr:hypothetical protein [Gammaproteobacteria bacterium]